MKYAYPIWHSSLTSEQSNALEAVPWRMQWKPSFSWHV